MATVPSYSNLQTSVSGLPNGQFQSPTGPTPGMIAADQSAQFGKAMSDTGKQVGAIVDDIQQDANLTVAKDLDNQMTLATSDALHNPDTGFMAKMGKDAIDGHNDAIANVQKIYSDAVSDIKNPMVRKIAAPVLDRRMQHAIEMINNHTGQESTRYQLQTSDSRAQINLQNAAQNYTDNNQFALALDVATGEAQSQGKLQGWDADTTQLQANKYKDQAFKLRYEAWRMKDPTAALESFQQNADQITPLVREQIGQQLFQAAAPTLAAQVNQAGGVGVVAQSPTDPALPRGIRNNNPGNISKGGDAWQGEVQGNDPRYVSFATPEAGIRAMGKLLLNYQDKYGLNTVEGIVSRWAPATENDTATYSSTVAKALGVKANAPIDMHDTDTLSKITRAMIQVENGPAAGKITDQQIALGLAAANGGAPLPNAPITNRRDPATVTGVSVVDALPSDQKQHVLQLALTQSHQDMADARESLRGKVQDATASYLTNGYAPNAPNEAEFIRAFGQTEGIGRFRDFQSVAALGQTLQQVKTLPVSLLTSLIDSAKPTPGDGYAVQQHNYETLTTAINQVQQARTQDPVNYALETNSYGIKPIKSFNDPKGFLTEITRRAAVASQMSSDYGTAPQLLTKMEAKALSANISGAPVESQKTQLATIYAGIGDIGMFKKTMQEIAPDNPTAAVAGIYQARGLRTTENRDVADLILRGQAILTPNTKEDGTGHMGGKSLIKMPEEKLMISDWNTVTGDAFQGKEQAADLFMQTAKAIYAARSAESGDYSGVINSGRWKSAINLATGGIQSHNGASIVMPYGMGYDQFQNALKAQTDSIVKSGGAVNTSTSEMMHLPLENVGDGRYLFRRGTGYLVNKDGRPVVADLSGGHP